MMENKIKIRKGGKLYYEGNEASGFPTAHHLHECFIELEDGLTLGDIFFLLKRDPDKWNELLGNWCSEFVTEGLKPRIVKEEEEEDFILDYLEVYRSIDINVFDPGEVIMSGINRPYFGGRGHYIKDDENMGTKAGDKIGIGVSFTPANELAPYPIKIKRDYEVWYYSDEDKPKKVYTITEMEVTLFDFLYIIIWELSFNGDPNKRNESKKELLKRVKEIGIEKGIA